MLYRAPDLGADGIVLNAPNGAERRPARRSARETSCRVSTPAGVADQASAARRRSDSGEEGASKGLRAREGHPPCGF